LEKPRYCNVFCARSEQHRTSRLHYVTKCRILYLFGEYWGYRFCFSYCLWLFRLLVLQYEKFVSTDQITCHNQGKGKVVAVHVKKSYSGIRGIAPLTLNCGARWRWVVILTSQLLYPGKEPRYPQEVGRAPAPVGTFRRREKLLPLPGMEHRLIEPVA
jgi:hypothetical protein